MNHSQLLSLDAGLLLNLPNMALIESPSEGPAHLNEVPFKSVESEEKGSTCKL